MFHFRDPALSRRNEIYLAILNRGILRIRNSLCITGSQFHEFEADHLHNIPSYIAGGDEAHHLYYLTVEVPLYVERLGELEVDEDQAQTPFDIELWRELETLIPIAGSPFESQWKTLKASGWNYGV